MQKEADLSDLSCPICMDSINDDFMEFTCDNHHRFHMECINRWVIHSSTCPICRTDLLENIGFIMRYCKCNRTEALNALRNCDHDLVSAIIWVNSRLGG